MKYAVSVRLDLEAMGALKVIEATGLTRSEAIRTAIIGMHDGLSEPSALAAEAETLRNDADDLAEVRSIRADLDGDADPWSELDS